MWYESSITMTLEKATGLVNQAGGADEINAEAQMLFSRFAPEKLQFLRPADSPVISRLGQFPTICPESVGFPRHISVRIGTHMHPHSFYITQSNSWPAYHATIHVATNIFLEH
jgi:hypothetical protein